MISYGLSNGPVHLVRFNTGEDILSGLTEFARDHDIGAGSFTYLGAVQRASLRYYDQKAQEYCDFCIHERLEVLAGVGNVSLLDGEPFVHTHAVFGDFRGRAFGGHINEGCDVFALEITFQELSGEPPVRQSDDCTGLTLWGGTLPTA
ncbi:MAG: PPC domain-containing DNA-binding protein [Acidimicrobiia bacterium]